MSRPSVLALLISCCFQRTNKGVLHYFVFVNRVILNEVNALQQKKNIRFVTSTFNCLSLIPNLMTMMLMLLTLTHKMHNKKWMTIQTGKSSMCLSWTKNSCHIGLTRYLKLSISRFIGLHIGMIHIQ